MIVGCGFVGAALASRLVGGGVEVFGGRRRTEGLPAGVLPWALDLRDPALGVPDGVTHLVFCAAPDEGSEEAYRRVYVEGLERVLAALHRQKSPLERVVFTSSTSVYAEQSGGLVTEDSPTLAGDIRADCLLAAEQMTQAQPGGVVARLSGIYGPGRERMIRMVLDGSARCATPSPIGNRIHRDDAAAMIEHLLKLPAPASCYLGVDDAPAPLDEVYRWLAEQLGVPPPPTSSEPDARGRGAFKRCSNARLKATGFSFRFPSYREGYGEMLRNRRPAAS